jgi:uncharacterized protein YrzB (UPF0473 family)
MADQIFEEMDVFTLTDEEGNENQFELLASADVEGVTYLALQPMEDENDDSYVILKLVTDENGDDILVTIDDDDEFDKIADLFEDEFMTMEYTDEQ